MSFQKIDGGKIKKILVTIQSDAGDSENRRNEGAFSPEMSRLGAEGGGSPFVKALENKKSSQTALRLNSYAERIDR
jgi:hypothetical protein